MAGRHDSSLTEQTGRDRDAGATIPTAPALITWVSAWLIANVIAVPAAVLIAGGDLRKPSPTVSVIALVAQWTVFLVALVFVSREFGTGSFVSDLGARVRAIDLLGLPIGALVQWIVLPLAYWPVRQLWPDTFSPEALAERSRSLIEGANGVVLVLLSVAAVIGAPVVEELVYRGLVQRSLGRRLGGVGALVFTSVLFAAVHFSAVDALGLVIAGLVFGAGVLVTGRIGFGLFAHIGFNAFAMTVLIATR